jgi:SAM-dependent methyltransferase
MSLERLYMSKNKKEYSEKWNQSAKYFYKNKIYEWMCSKIDSYHTILEIGCGTGYSTLSLLKKGHKVVAVDYNKYCISATKKLLEKHGYACANDVDSIKNNDVILLNEDITQIHFMSYCKYEINCVVLWNVGTHTPEGSELTEKILKLVEFGFHIEQIKRNFSSSNSEFIVEKSIEIAANLNTPIQLIERNIEPIKDIKNNSYYQELKSNFFFNSIIYDFINTTSLSSQGVTLTNSSEPSCEIFLNSLLYK